MANFTVEGNYTSKLDQTTTPWLAGIVVFLATLNIFLSITASFGNILILIALHKVTSLYPPSKLLFRCLAVTDLCVGLISHPLHSTYLLSYIKEMNFNIIRLISGVNSALSVTLCAVSLVTSTAISLDRLLALSLGMRYRQIVTLRRIRAITVCSWMISVLMGSMYFWSQRILWIAAFFFVIVCLVTSIFSYTKINLKLRQHQVQVQVHQGQPNGGGTPLDIARYKKTVSSILWVQLTLIVCYVPSCIVALLRINGKEYWSRMAWLFTVTLIYMNASLNPILYCWKIIEVRQGVKNAIRHCCVSS